MCVLGGGGARTDHRGQRCTPAWQAVTPHRKSGPGCCAGERTCATKPTKTKTMCSRRTCEQRQPARAFHSPRQRGSLAPCSAGKNPMPPPPAKPTSQRASIHNKCLVWSWLNALHNVVKVLLGLVRVAVLRAPGEMVVVSGWVGGGGRINAHTQQDGEPRQGHVEVLGGKRPASARGRHHRAWRCGRVWDRGGVARGPQAVWVWRRQLPSTHHA